MECIGITGLIISDTDTSIGNQAFSGCSEITGTVRIPGSVESIGNQAFSGCSKINGTVRIPGSVKSMYPNAFSGCIGITELLIPEGVKIIGDFPKRPIVVITYHVNEGNANANEILNDW
jgi:hypothetical protein